MHKIVSEKDAIFSELEEKFQEYKEYATSKLQLQQTEITNLKDAVEVR